MSAPSSRRRSTANQFHLAASALRPVSLPLEFRFDLDLLHFNANSFFLQLQYVVSLVPNPFHPFV